MNGIKLNLVAGGAALTMLGSLGGAWITARHSRTYIGPQPLVVVLEKEFVKRDEFEKFAQQNREDIRRLESRVERQGDETAKIRNEIYSRLGVIEGKVNFISDYVKSQQKGGG
ncbi:MAG: hypothetical protein FWH21_07205 [Kiritimatiellaeota bacterium]|nr:hypothetical protein [Kiritimatiellota bacterium]